MAVGLKICGITRPEDLRACAELGVEAVGLNLWPRSRRHLPVTELPSLLAAGEAPDHPRPLRVAVFVEATPTALERGGVLEQVDLLQPHGDAAVEPYAELAQRHGLGWIWVVRGTPSLEALTLPTPAPRWVLLDAAVEGFGGAGKRTDWGWAAEAVQALAPLPVWLAGGIRPDNAYEAIARVRPAGLDVASGAEPPGAHGGHKQREAIEALVEACRGA